MAKLGNLDNDGSFVQVEDEAEGDSEGEAEIENEQSGTSPGNGPQLNSTSVKTDLVNDDFDSKIQQNLLLNRINAETSKTSSGRRRTSCSTTATSLTTSTQDTHRSSHRSQSAEPNALALGGQSVREVERSSDVGPVASFSVGKVDMKIPASRQSAKGRNIRASSNSGVSGNDAEDESNRSSEPQSMALTSSRSMADQSMKKNGTQSDMAAFRRSSRKDAKEDPIGGRVTALSSSLSSTSTLTVSTLTTSTSAGSKAGLNHVNRQEWEVKRNSLRPNTDAVTSTAPPDKVHRRPLTNPIAIPTHPPPAEPELVVATLVSDDNMDSSSSADTSERNRDSIEPMPPLPEEDPNLVTVHATPENLEDSVMDILKSHKGRCFILVLVVFVAVVTGGLVIGISAGRSKPHNIHFNDTTANTNDPSASPSHTTMTPMRMPSMPPTMMPSSAPSLSMPPSTEFVGYAVDNLLPNYTLSALQNSSSPQFHALQWLQNEHSPELLANLTDERLIQRFSLATLFYATNGDLWMIRSRWMSPTVHECDWWSHAEVLGATPQPICNKNEAYIALLLSKNLLKGTLPPEIALLSSLEEIRFESDAFRPNEDKRNLYLSGPLPSELGLLSNLRILDVSKNALSSTIPSELFDKANSLVSIHLLENYLTGSIPSELALSTGLERLFLYDNALTSSIPSELGLLSASLLLFKAYKNGLSGSLSTELGLLTKLTSLEIGENRLTSSIPKEVGFLSSLRWFGLKQNKLTGELPPFANLREVQQLHWESNQLSGSIPTSIGNMTNLKKLFLNDNKLSGSIPSEVGKLARNEGIRLDDNDMIGEVPSEVCALHETGSLKFSIWVDCEQVLCECGCCHGCRCEDRNITSIFGGGPSSLSNGP
ncbi:Leucine Rich Repeat [Seminavis robusta]|uniref:Leucine Rich Repeat n=1 Tax=Seminavis robusta TaxID=568900 RepID=A0A9N8HB21_9STRA|nr:Leucine Rich Repeat [Seminavis robusta]|eukprot:Sro319_g116310.1 Leucine Rich Repeat (881) ;mRNA; f:50061-52956